MIFSDQVRYHKEHTWVRVEGNVAYIGISDFAQSELGEIIFVDLPNIGEIVTQGESFGNVESVKTVSALYAPVSGKVININESLDDRPELVNTSPFEEGWMIQVEIQNGSEVDSLLNADQYKRLVLEDDD